MRVIEPNRFPSKAQKTRKRRKSSSNKKSTLVITVLFILISVVIIYTNKKAEAPVQPTKHEETPVTLEQEATPELNIQTGLRQFSGNEFRLLFDNMLLPNTIKVELPPAITGMQVADARIRVLAETRGYKLRRSPSTAQFNVDDNPMQNSVKQPWQNLKAEALSVGIDMRIVSGYRSVEDQRLLFLSRLKEAGVSISSIDSGTADSAVDKLLATTALPGYSKHHTGYAFDILCEGWIFENFKYSECHDWLSENNFENAKRYGFIPSYPLDADLQGPDPEAWEYVYVGLELLNY